MTLYFYESNRMTVTKILGEQSGIQYQGVVDKSEADPRDNLVNALFIGQFKNGPFNKPFKVTAANIRKALGFDPENLQYQAIEDCLKQGVPFVWVMRMDGGNIDGPGGTLREERVSTYIEWSENGQYLFIQDQPKDSLPIIRWFELSENGNELNEMPLFISDSGHISGESVTLKTSPDGTLLALWDTWKLNSQRPEILDISTPSNVKKIIVDPPYPFMGENYNEDVLYDNGIQQLIFTDDNQYLVYSVYGNTNRQEVEGLISVYKRSEDGTQFNLIKKVMDVHSSHGMGVSIVGSKMRIVGCMADYLYGFILDLETNNLIDLGYKNVEINSGSYQGFHKINDNRFIAESQFYGFAIITFNANNDGFVVEKINGNNGASRNNSYFNDPNNNEVVYYFGVSYSNELVYGVINGSAPQMSNFQVYNPSQFGSSAPDYFKHSKLSPIDRFTLAHFTAPAFFGSENVVNLISYNSDNPVAIFAKKQITINYLPGMEYA